MQFAIIGLGGFGTTLALELSRLGGEVIVIDKDEKIINSLKNHVAYSVIADCTDEMVLRAHGINLVDIAIVCIGDNTEISILTTAILKKIGVPRIFTRAVNVLHAGILKEIGADEVIRIEEEMGANIAKRIVSPYILEMTTFPAGYSVVEIYPPNQLIGKKIIETNIRKLYGINIVAIRKRSPDFSENGRRKLMVEMNYSVHPQDEINENDILVIVGGENNINKFLKEIK